MKAALVVAYVAKTPEKWAGGLERVKGIEPSSQAWEARILPLNHTRFRSEYFLPDRMWLCNNGIWCLLDQALRPNIEAIFFLYEHAIQHPDLTS